MKSSIKWNWIGINWSTQALNFVIEIRQYLIENCFRGLFSFFLNSGPLSLAANKWQIVKHWKELLNSEANWFDVMQRQCLNLAKIDIFWNLPGARLFCKTFFLHSKPFLILEISDQNYKFYFLIFSLAADLRLVQWIRSVLGKFWLTKDWRNEGGNRGKEPTQDTSRVQEQN